MASSSTCARARIAVAVVLVGIAVLFPGNAVVAVGAWLAEQPRYNYWSNSCAGGMCGHYTQIMWRATRRVGCAMVTCYNGRGTFITCNYDPPGNYVGVRPY
uniref:SCP domain-containing protein n=1 Tax=Oryza brachyantha TaxID=4533 RepID=J3LHT3_ORYBR